MQWYSVVLFCGGVDYTDSVLVFRGYIGVTLAFGFWALKLIFNVAIRMIFGTIVGGTLPHRHENFRLWEIPLTREIFDFRRNFGIFLKKSGPRYSPQNFIPDGG